MSSGNGAAFYCPTCRRVMQPDLFGGPFSCVCGVRTDIPDPAPAELEDEPLPERDVDYRAQASAWIAENPEAYALFRRFAVELADAGVPRFGVRPVVERVRYEHWTARGDYQFRVPNNVAAYVARRLLVDEPVLRGRLALRRVRW